MFVRLFQQLGQQQQQQQQQKENVDDQDRSIFRRLLIDDASTKEDFRRAVRSVLVPSTALPLPASPSSSPAHKKPKGSVECVVARQVHDVVARQVHDVVVDLTGDDAPSGAQPVVASAPNMAHARLSNTCPAVHGSVPSSVPEPVFDVTGSDDGEASRSDRGSSRRVSSAPAVQTEITKFFERVQKSQEETRGSSSAAPAPRTTTSADRAADRMTLDSGEDDDDDLDEDDLAAIEASRDRAADHMTVDWGEEDEVDWEALDAIEAKYRQGQMSGVAIDADGTEGTLHD